MDSDSSDHLTKRSSEPGDCDSVLAISLDSAQVPVAGSLSLGR